MDMDHVLSKAELTHSSNDRLSAATVPELAPPPDLMLAGGAWLAIMALLDALLLGIAPFMLGLRFLGLALLTLWWWRGPRAPRWLPPLWLVGTVTGQVAATYFWVDAGVGATAMAGGTLAGFLLLPVAAPLLREVSHPLPPAAAPTAPADAAVPMPVLRLAADSLNSRLNAMAQELDGLTSGPVSPAQAIQLRLLRNEVSGMQALVRQRLGGGAVAKAEPLRATVSPPAPAALSVPGPSSVRSAGAANGRSAMVVDDDAVGRTLTRLLLEQAGYSVEDTDDAKMALEMALMEGPDVALVSARIGQHSGLALAWCIRRGGGPPVVLLRGRADRITDRQRQRSGLAAILGKPATSDTLAATLDPLLVRHAVVTAAPPPPPPPPPPAPPVAAADTGPVLDLGVLEEHLSILGAERVAQIIDSFSRNAPATLAAVAQALDRGDVPEVGKAAHKLASGALTVGLGVLARLAKQADSAARKGDGDTALAAARQFPAAFAAGQAALAGYRRDRLTVAGP
jgi:CheY-like chemotaxis protein